MTPQRLDATFAALADPTRRAILARLASGEASVTELAEPFGRRNAALHAAALAVSRRLSASPEPAARWVGKDALRELTSPSVIGRLAPRGRGGGRG